MRLILASASPRRADLLRASGIDFDVRAADVDESMRSGEDAESYVRRVAEAKARTVLSSARGRPVLAADTVVVLDGIVFGKPRDRADAARMLRALAGRRHDVLTAVVLAMDRPGGASIEARLERTGVEFRRLTDEEVAAYVASGEPMDKAGAYAVQGSAAGFVARMEGSYANVVGLPVALVGEMMKSFQIPLGKAAPRV